MNWNNPDTDPGESEDEYIARKREESDSATGLMFVVVGGFIFVLKIAAIFGMFFYAGFLLSQKFWGEETDKFKIWSFSLLFTYLIFCIIYVFIYYIEQNSTNKTEKQITNTSSIDYEKFKKEHTFVSIENDFNKIFDNINKYSLQMYGSIIF